MKIILVRHAETIKNKSGHALGQVDSDITPEGHEQLIKAQKFLKNEKIDLAFCSPLGRAQKSAEIILAPHDIKPVPDSRLKELNWGDWVGYQSKELIEKWSQFYESKKKDTPRTEIRPPNGENSFDHLNRIRHFFEDEIFPNQDKTILILGHSGTNKVIIGFLEGKDPEEFYTIEQRNACINIIELEGRRVVSSRLNLTNHLD